MIQKNLILGFSLWLLASHAAIAFADDPAPKAAQQATDQAAPKTAQEAPAQEAIKLIQEDVKPVKEAPKAPPGCPEYTYEQAMDLSEKTPDKIFSEPACFIKMQKAINVFVSAAKENPAAAFEGIEKFVDEEWADEVINTAASRVPETAFRIYKTYKETPSDRPKYKKSLEMLKNNLKEAAYGAIKKEDYWTVLAFADLYADEEWAKDAVIYAGKKDLLTFLTYKKVQDAKWFKKFLKEVVYATIEETPGTVIEAADGFIEEPWSKDAIASAAEKAPESAFRYFKIYSKNDWGREILAKTSFMAFEKSPWILLENAPLYAILDSGSWFWKIFPERENDRDYRTLLAIKIRETAEDPNKDNVLRQLDVREVDYNYIRELLEKKRLKTNHNFMQSSPKDFFQGLANSDQEPSELKLIFILDNLRASSRFNQIRTATAILDLWVSARAPLSIREIINMEGHRDDERLAVIRDFNPRLFYEAIVNYNDNIPKTVFALIFNGGNYLGPEKKNTLMSKIFTWYKTEEVLKFFQEADPNGWRVGKFLQICAAQDKLGDFLNAIRKKEDRQKLFSMRLSNEAKWEMLKYVSKEERQPLFDAIPEGPEKQKLLQTLK